MRFLSKPIIAKNGGDEGGEFLLEKPDTNTSIDTGVTVDVYQNKLRFFEQGGTARGAYIDITACSGGVGTNLLSGGGGSSAPTGSLLGWAGTITQSVSAGVITTTAPTGYVMCDGSAISRTTYASLFAVIGTAYGTGDGSTTFNLPNITSNILAGTSTDGGRGNAASKTVTTSSSAITATSTLTSLLMNTSTVTGTVNSTFAANTGNSNVNLSHTHSYVGNVTARNTGATDVGIHSHNYDHSHSFSSGVAYGQTAASSSISTTGNAAAQAASITATALYWIIKT